MKEIKVSVNTWYVVEGTAGATVTNPSTNRVIATIEDGKQASFYATTPYVLASDDSVSVYKATFNCAPAKLRLLGLLGGGVSTASALPEGYIEADFLESTGTQRLNAIGQPFLSTERCAVGMSVDGQLLDSSGARTIGGVFLSANGTFTPYQFANETSSLSFGKMNIKTGSLAKNSRFFSALNIKGDYTYEFKNEDVNLKGNLTWNVSTTNTSKNMLFAGSNYSRGRIWSVVITENGKPIQKLRPALTEKGVPCLFDELSQAPLEKIGSGDFIIGLTLKQSRKLSDLPAGGGTLTVSLPTGYESDEGVMSALETARSNGWTLTVQTYEAETAAATFGMRRVWVRKTQDEHGTYIDSDGNRWQVDWCVTMYTPDGSEPDAHGYELFRSVDTAVAYWELEPWVDPNAEKLLTEYNANE